MLKSNASRLELYASDHPLYTNSSPHDSGNDEWIQPSIISQPPDQGPTLLIHGVYVKTPNSGALMNVDLSEIEFEHALQEMALDADIQREIFLIDEEFACAESDGLYESE